MGAQYPPLVRGNGQNCSPIGEVNRRADRTPGDSRENDANLLRQQVILVRARGDNQPRLPRS
jgi:hypothetical protein